MAAEIPSQEPTSFIAGDTVKWTKDLSDYPVGTWTMTYYFRSKDAPAKSVLCTTSGSLHLATITAAVSATFAPGEYFVFARVASADEEYTVWEGTITVKANPAVGTSPQDRRSFARQVRDALRDMILGLAPRFEQSYTIDIPGGGNRQLATLSRAEAITALSHFEQLVRQEEQAERIAQGLAPRNKISVRFVSP